MAVTFLTNEDKVELENSINNALNGGKQPLVGTIDEVTPSQAYNAIKQGQEVHVTAKFEFDVGSDNVTFANLQYEDVAPGKFHLVGSLIKGGVTYKSHSGEIEPGYRVYYLEGSNTASAGEKWNVRTAYVPSTDSKFPNPYSLTIKDSNGNTLTTYDGRYDVELTLPESSSGGGEGGLVAPIPVMTSAAKPSEVFEAVNQGANIWIGHTDSTYGTLVFQSATLYSDMNIAIYHTIVELNGIIGVCMLYGDLNTDTWSFSAKPIGGGIVGTTSDVTPTQVYDAIKEGLSVQITHTDSAFGVMTCTNFALAESLGQCIFSTVVYYNGVPVALQLTGSKSSNQWNFQIMPLTMTSM